jgi:hypothetical protein
MTGAWEGRRRYSRDTSYGPWPCVEATSRASCPPMPHPSGPFIARGDPTFAERVGKRRPPRTSRRGARTVRPPVRRSVTPEARRADPFENQSGDGELSHLS